jgi:tetratricopeptide (TPR) repeat protein
VDGTNFVQAKERVQLGQGNRTTPTGRGSGGETVQINFSLDVRPNSGRSDSPINNTVVFAQEIPPLAAAEYGAALRHLKDKRLDDGIAGLERAIQIFPDYYLALDRLGFEYLNSLKFNEAEKVFTRAIEINRKGQSSRSGLGIALYKLKKWDEAARTLEETVVDNSGSANSHLLLGKIYRETEDFEKSESNLKKAKTLAKGKLPDVHWELALLYYYDLKRLPAAADELELYLKASPKAENRVQVEKLIKTIRKDAKENS